MVERGSFDERFLGAVERFVDETGLLGGVRRLVVACSGGGDSTALLDLLDRGAAEWGIELAVAHLDHGWRGAESSGDARRVRELAESRGLPLFVERLQEGGEGAAAVGGDGVAEVASEARARAARHAFFRRVCKEWPGDAVALGHTADDRAETLLLNLARGSGRTGLAAMQERRRVDGLLLVRPLLAQSREDARRYCRERGISWREDSSNRLERFGRVHVRRRVLPALEAGFPGAADRLARTAGLLADEEEWLAELTRQELERLRVEEPFPGALALQAEGLAALTRPLARRVLRAALGRVRGNLDGVSMEHVEVVLDVVVTGIEGARDLPGVRVRSDDGTLRLLPLEGRRLRSPGGD